MMSVEDEQKILRNCMEVDKRTVGGEELNQRRCAILEDD